MFVIDLEDLVPYGIFLSTKRPHKGHFSSVLSFCINIFLTSLFLIPQLRHFSFEYGGYKFLVGGSVWIDFDKHVFFCVWYCWLGTLWLWKVFPKCMLTIGSIVVGELVVVISISTVSGVLKTFYTLISKSMYSWYLFVFNSKF